MALALDLARRGVGRTSPNPAVGAVIVRGGKVISAGFHRGAGLPHAEIEALTPLLTKEGAWGRSATLYVTLEPCCPPKIGGRTAPCTEAIIQSGIKEVVIGMRDPDRRIAGRGVRILKESGIAVREKVLENECKRLNEAYIKHRMVGLPFVTLKIASSLDGKVAFPAGSRRRRHQWITGPAARDLGHRLRDRADAILVGINTVLKDDPRLTTRLPGKRGKDPIRIVLDSDLRIPPTARVVTVRSNAPAWITTTRPSDSAAANIIKSGKVDILTFPKNREGQIDLGSLVRDLAARGIIDLLVEGGPAVWGSFLRAGLVDKVVLFLAPIFIGDAGIPIFSDKKATLRRLKETTVRPIGTDIMIEGYL